MWRLFLILLTILGMSPALAQDAAEEGDRGYLQALIEDNLSTDGTQVRIEGFVGSVFSTSSIDRLTVADADGTWLTMTGLKLDWSRTALLERRLEITELSVQRIELDRLPPSGGKSAPKAEATPFRLPELPLEIDIQKISAGAISLGQSILGAPATLSLDGSATLSGGSGQATLQANRLDGPTGRFTIAAGFANDTEQLDLDIRLEEAADGIAANLMQLEGRPSVRMSITGSAPLAQFEAKLALATDGVPRVSGTVALSRTEGSEEAPEAATALDFRAALSGDVAPLVAPALAPFFGDSISLTVNGRNLPDGRVQISALTVETAALQITGKLDLAANGLPERFDLTGQIASATGQPVTLPLPGKPTVLTRADVTAQFDAATGDAWHATAVITDFNRDGLSIVRSALDANGTIGTTDARRVSATIGFAASGIGHTDEALAQALGRELTGAAVLKWTEGAPLQLEQLQVNGAGLALRAAATLDTLGTGLAATGEAELQAESIDRFAALAGRDIAGGIRLRAEGSGSLLGGDFDLSLSAEATDLVTATPQLDPLLRGASEVRIDAKRDETGTELSLLSVRAPALQASASGRLSSDAGQLDLQAALTDLSLVEPRLEGDAAFDTSLSWQKDEPVQIAHLRLSGTGIELTGSGEVDLSDERLPASGQAELHVAALSQFSGLAGRQLSGAVEASVRGSGQIRGTDFDLSLEASGEDLGIGLAEVDKLLAGTSKIVARAGRTAGQYSIDNLDVETPVLTASARSTAGAGSALAFNARLANVGLFAPDFPGPAEMQGTAEPVGQDWTVALTGTGPGGTTANVRGLVAGDLGNVDLAVTGSAPLGMTNPFIAPRSLQGAIAYDLQLAGRPALENLSGRLSTTGARLSAPTLKMVLTDIEGTVDVAGTQAQIGLSARSSEGGGLRIDGSVSLRPGYAASLKVALSQLGLTDPALYRTTVDGDLSLDGPLTGGGKISGAVDIGRTEVQVTTGGTGGGEIIPGLIHVNEPAASRRTRARAGLLAAEADAAGSGGAPLGLDVLIRAPSQIFIRGRGLDAEFGGQLRIAGTTADVIPIGQFALIRGRLDLLGKRFDLTEGQVNIQGSLDPYMRIVAETTSDTVTSRIVIEGQVSSPEVSFESEPELPEDEIVAQLLFGRDLSTLSAFQALQLAGAVATLTGRSDGGVVSKLRSGVGLDDLDISSTAEGETEVRAGKYLTDNLYSDVVVDSAGKTEVNLNFDISSKLKVKGRVDSEGDTGIGIYYQRDY